METNSARVTTWRLGRSTNGSRLKKCLLYDAVASVEVPVVLTIKPSTWALGGRRMKVTYLLFRCTLS
ncbi:hypothetical protein D9M69_721300 [compost metagenome]